MVQSSFCDLFEKSHRLTGGFVALDALVLVVRSAFRHVHSLGAVFDLFQGSLPIRIAIVGC